MVEIKKNSVSVCHSPFQVGVEPVVVVEVVAAENTCAHNRARVVVVAVALLDVLHYCLKF